MPKTLAEHLVIESAKKLNFFPVQHRASKWFSSGMIVHKENLDNKYLEFALGEHTQALNEPSKANTNAPRALDYSFSCLMLRSKVGINYCIYLQVKQSPKGKCRAS